MQTGTPDPDTLPPLDLSRFDPQATQLAGLDGSAAKPASPWTAGLTVSCAPAFHPFGELPPAGTLASAASPANCLSQPYTLLPASTLNYLPGTVLGVPFARSFFSTRVMAAPSFPQFGNFMRAPASSGLTISAAHGPLAAPAASTGTVHVQKVPSSRQ